MRILHEKSTIRSAMEDLSRGLRTSRNTRSTSLFRVEATFSSAAIATKGSCMPNLRGEIYQGNHGDPLHIQVFRYCPSLKPCNDICVHTVLFKTFSFSLTKGATARSSRPKVVHNHPIALEQ